MLPPSRTDTTHGQDTTPRSGILLQKLSEQESVPSTAAYATSPNTCAMPRFCARTSPFAMPLIWPFRPSQIAPTLLGRLAHDPAEEREGVASSDFLDIRVGVAPLDQTTDDVLAIRG
jgi:hypothetical protein